MKYLVIFVGVNRVIKIKENAVQQGFTLVEVMLALMIMAMIAVVAGQAFNTAATSSAATRDAMERLAEIDSAFVLIENDLRNAMAKQYVPTSNRSDHLLPILISNSEEYWMTLLRGGVDNPLHQLRTEEIRVGYRYIDQTLWRDTWYNPIHIDQQDARPRKILTGVETLSVEVLPYRAVSIAGSWQLTWPHTQMNPATELPKAIRLKIELEDMGEITRVFSVLPWVPPKL